MLMSLPLPPFGTESISAKIHIVHAAEGVLLAPGSALFDVAVDFSGGVSYNCAPISYFRIIMRDRVWVRKLFVALDDDVAPGTCLANLSTEPDEAADAAPAREARVTLMSVLTSDDWWDDPA